MTSLVKNLYARFVNIHTLKGMNVEELKLLKDIELSEKDLEIGKKTT